MIKSYFALDAIGVEEERVTVTFCVPAFRLERDLVVRGKEGARQETVTPGSTAVVPLWAATPLRHRGFVTVQLSSPFLLKTFREFKTDPLAASLAAKSPYFYEAGLALAGLLGQRTAQGGMSSEGNRLAAQLFRLYQLRYLKIIVAGAKKGLDLSDLREKLTANERELLDSYRRGRAEEQLWYASTL